MSDNSYGGQAGLGLGLPVLILAVAVVAKTAVQT